MINSSLQFHAFTQKYPGRTNRIITKVQVAGFFDPATTALPHPNYVETDALWDTGATQSVITRKTVEDLQLVAVGTTLVNHGNGQSTHNTYLINIKLPNQVDVIGVMATELENVVDNFGVIIGMDIIGAGDFAFTNANGISCLSFRLPSMQQIDYVSEWNTKVKSTMQPNALCFCGSNRKFKKCHGARA